MTTQKRGERLRDASPFPVDADDVPELVNVEWQWSGPNEFDQIIGRRMDWYPVDAPTLTVYFSGSGAMGEHWPPPVGWKIRESDGVVGHDARKVALVDAMRVVPRVFWKWMLNQHSMLMEFLQQKINWEIDRATRSSVISTGELQSLDRDDPHGAIAKHIGGAAMDMFRLAREWSEAQGFMARNDISLVAENGMEWVRPGLVEKPNGERFGHLTSEEMLVMASGVAVVSVVQGPFTSRAPHWRVEVAAEGHDHFHCVGDTLHEALLDVLGQLSATGFPLAEVG